MYKDFTLIGLPSPNFIHRKVMLGMTANFDQIS